MSFNLDDYKDVAERIREFNDKYPDGSLQGEGHFVSEPVVGYLYRARAFRTPDDPRPGIGTAFEPIPGKTSYTRDSEVQNAETAAWGRAIVALGFETKKIASKQEVKARQTIVSPTAPVLASAAAQKRIHAIISEIASQRGVPREQVHNALRNALDIESLSNLSAENAAKADGILADWKQKVTAKA